MDKIISVFRPWLDTIPNLDYAKTKLGWARVTNLPYEEQIQFLQGPENMLCALAGDFFDRAEGGGPPERRPQTPWRLCGPISCSSPLPWQSTP